MTIGEALKEERQRLGFTQAKMVDGIISRSFYAKVERGEKQIGSELLAKILFKHQIDIEDFYEKIKSNYAPNEMVKAMQLSKRIGNAFNNHQIDLVKKYRDEILELLGNNILKLRAIVVTAYLEDNIQNLPVNINNRIFREFDKNDNWTTDVESLRLFANTMPVFSLEQLDFFISRLLNKVNKIELSELEKERIAIICDNFLLTCYEKKYRSENIQLALHYLLNLDSNAHLLIYRISGLYDKALLENNKKRLKEIKNFLISCGYESLIKNWQ